MFMLSMKSFIILVAWRRAFNRLLLDDCSWLFLVFWLFRARPVISAYFTHDRPLIFKTLRYACSLFTCQFKEFVIFIFSVKDDLANSLRFSNGQEPQNPHFLLLGNLPIIINKCIFLLNLIALAGSVFKQFAFQSALAVEGSGNLNPWKNKVNNYGKRH